MESKMKKQGFTLIELLVVIAVIAVLMPSLPACQGGRQAHGLSVQSAFPDPDFMKLLRATWGLDQFKGK